MNELLLMHIIIIWYHQDHSIHSAYSATICFILALVLVITIVYHCFSVSYHATYSSAMKVEAASSSETAAYLLYHTLSHPIYLFFSLFYIVKIFKPLNFIIKFPSFHCLNVSNDVLKIPYRIKQSVMYPQTSPLSDDTVVFSFFVYYTHLSCVWSTDLYFHFILRNKTFGWKPQWFPI
jgi:hypothetical protein